MIEFTVCCDECGAIVHASKVSSAHARDEARLMCGAIRVKKRDLCFSCAGEMSEARQAPKGDTP